MYDGYRPQIAVNEFIAWGSDLDDISTKQYYYPTLEKNKLYEEGYLPNKKSTHSRGSTFDLTLIKIDHEIHPIKYSKRTLTNSEEIVFLDDGTVDMGASFDLFHAASHHDTALISSTQTEMRNLLRDGMRSLGFKEYKVEWWHYTLEDEPYPDTYFNFILL